MARLIKHIKIVRDSSGNRPDRYNLEIVDVDGGTVLFELSNRELALKTAKQIGAILNDVSLDRVIVGKEIEDMV